MPPGYLVGGPPEQPVAGPDCNASCPHRFGSAIGEEGDSAGVILGHSCNYPRAVRRGGTIASQSQRPSQPWPASASAARAAAAMRPTASSPSSSGCGRSLICPTPMMTGIRAGFIVHSPFPARRPICDQSRVGRQNFRHNSLRRLAECVPCLGLILCGELAMLQAQIFNGLSAVFFISPGEVAFSGEMRNQFELCRVFDFDVRLNCANIYSASGAIEEHFDLTETQFSTRASSARRIRAAITAQTNSWSW